MGATVSGDLSRRLDAVLEEAKARAKAFQDEAELTRHETRDRFQLFLSIAERIVAIGREKLECLRTRLNCEVIPAQVQHDRFYSRSVTFDLKSELAGVLKLSFRLSNDADVRRILLDYDLEIVPVFFEYEPHRRLELPLAEFEEATVAKWLDDRIVEFARAYLDLMSTKQYQERVLVTDTVAGISFPKYFAAATLEHEGSTYYFISQETRREFAEQRGLKT
jgi:hypothetical protein